ncbi:MAG: tRNA (N(6)-L-threonylcarbamoyladenosine(37)-C(2))-methylthiotransferase MtaB [Muribaculaceae bacterium]|nr:tRNA (N(6)-L-threonylcarbamoyladenosine(37)-C(2))-methylthiotransferase MtaB [Muribaculaceae bacterium]
MIDNTVFARPLKALYHTFGCKLNFAETASVADVFASRGIHAAAKDETPDIIVVNSCSVTAEADRKCRSTIRSFNRRYPQALILVTGCYAQLKPDELRALPGVGVVAGVNDKLALADMAEAYLAGRDAAPEVPEAKELRDFMPSCSRGDRTRYFLKVQDGCDYWCTYCTIPKARGRSRSGSIEQIVEQARKAAAEGGREIVITGVNIGDFGHGRDDSFIDLCRELDKVDGIERYRISSIEPNLLTDELIDFVGSSRAFMPHFHIPLQCGDDEVLQLMRRRYGTALFAAKVERVRRVMPDAFIGVDLIVGARGETPERFESSRAFVDSLDISHLHVFTYSERPGTRALQIEHVVSQEEKHRRSAVMMALSARKHAAFAERFLGSVRPVLLEHTRPGHRLGGFTDNYLRVECDLPQSYDNRLVMMRLDSLGDDGETVSATLAQ